MVHATLRDANMRDKLFTILLAKTALRGILDDMMYVMNHIPHRLKGLT